MTGAKVLPFEGARKRKALADMSDVECLQFGEDLVLRLADLPGDVKLAAVLWDGAPSMLRAAGPGFVNAQLAGALLGVYQRSTPFGELSAHDVKADLIAARGEIKK